MSRAKRTANATMRIPMPKPAAQDPLSMGTLLIGSLERSSAATHYGLPKKFMIPTDMVSWAQWNTREKSVAEIRSAFACFVLVAMIGIYLPFFLRFDDVVTVRRRLRIYLLGDEFVEGVKSKCTSTGWIIFISVVEYLPLPFNFYEPTKLLNKDN